MNEHLPRYSSTPQRSSDRSFGIVFAVFFLLIAFLPLWHGQPVRIWALILSVLFGVLAFVAPSILAPLNRLWAKVGEILHRIVSPIALGILFFGVVTPIGLLVRLFGMDALRLRLDKTASSYWIPRSPGSPAPESMKDQF